MFMGKHSRIDYKGTRQKEPMWSRDDPLAELGWSWESVVLGRISKPLRDLVGNRSPLFSSDTYVWPSHDSKKHAAIDAIMNATTSPDQYVRRIPLDPSIARFFPHLNRHENYPFSWDAPRTVNFNYVCITQAIPVRWIVNWFQEEFWADKRRDWQSRRFYEPPRLGPSWCLMLIRWDDAQAEMRVVTNLERDPNLGNVNAIATQMGLSSGEPR